MRYLCPKHQLALQNDPAEATRLWRRSMDLGLIAAQSDRQHARLHFGAAFETTLLYHWHSDDCSNPFQVDQLIDAGMSLARTLFDLGITGEAEVCLLTVQNALLQLSHQQPEGPQRELIAELMEHIEVAAHRVGADNAMHYNRELKPTVESQPATPVSPFALISALCFLLTRYSESPQGKLAQTISDYFLLLSEQGNCPSPLLSNSARRLARQWQQKSTPDKAASKPHLLQASRKSVH